MNPKLLLSLALVFLAGLASTPPAVAMVDVFQLFPTNSSGHPISVQVTNGDFGIRYSVFYRTNQQTLDQFLHASLMVASEDNQMATCPVEKMWTTNGVLFEFTVASAFLEASKFSFFDQGHVVGSGAGYWFYLRDFATNNVSFARRVVKSNEVPPEIIKALPERMRALRAGTSSAEVWKQLNLAAYRTFAGVSYPEHERWWLGWNYELELYFEEPPTNRPYFDKNNRKFIRAILYKNGLEISNSGK